MDAWRWYWVNLPACGLGISNRMVELRSAIQTHVNVPDDAIVSTRVTKRA